MTRYCKSNDATVPVNEGTGRLFLGRIIACLIVKNVFRLHLRKLRRMNPLHFRSILLLGVASKK